MKRIYLMVATVLLWGAAAFAQAPESTISWKATSSEVETGLFEIVLSGAIADGWHTYDLSHPLSPTSLTVEESDAYTVEGLPYLLTQPVESGGEMILSESIRIAQKIRLNAPEATVTGTVRWQSCTNEYCGLPEEHEFTLKLAQGAGNGAEKAVNKNVSSKNKNVSQSDSQTIQSESTQGGSQKASLWSLILEAILWGLTMLQTPCVFPMVPMTISFFMKGSSSPSAGRFKAFMYGLFIVLLYTVPICLIIGLTWLLGGDTVTADIFNWLSTHWLPNLIFFLVFMVFAASFFGAFEITLPSSLVNKSDAKSDKGGLGGIFFMALTLVLVSFSCTGPIVGSVLIKSTQGEFWTPMITMLAFSVAFALPFTIFALFPSLLKKLKSGSWLNSVKVVLGFIEVALGLKFLSVPDQTYHWGILDREVYLAIWIVVFTLLGLYLLGKIRFAHDEPVEHIGVFRLSLIIAVFSFVVYLIPGMFGAPLKGISGYLPPIETQDFIVYNHADGPQLAPSRGPDTAALPATGESTLKMPLGLSGYFTLQEGLEAAAKAGKPLFVDMTGHGCTNCREMESRVWSDPRVLQRLRDDFVLTALYTDDKTRLEEKDWVTAENGKVLKDMGRVNSYIVRTRFGVNAQPNYAIVSPDGELLVPVRGYNLDIDGFVAFLQSGLDAYRAKNK